MKNTENTIIKPPRKLGILVMAANHIGNPTDVPPRTISLLRDSEILIFEEDRFARALLKQAGITKNYLKYNEHCQKQTIEVLKDTLLQGKSAMYVSDQGSPTLADPGKNLLQVAYDLNAAVKVIPGPSSITAAISACPFELRDFHFVGFLPRKEPLRQQKLRSYLNNMSPLIILDTPYRLHSTLQALQQSVILKKRNVFLALDITGPQESYYLGKIQKVVLSAKHISKTNFVIIIEGKY